MKAPWHRQIQPDRTVLFRNGKIWILNVYYHVFFNFHGSDPRVAKLILGLCRLSIDEKRSMKAPWNRQIELVPKMLLLSFSERSEAEICSWKPSTTYATDHEIRPTRGKMYSKSWFFHFWIAQFDQAESDDVRELSWPPKSRLKRVLRSIYL